jgi:hypothetical protein
MDDQEEIMIAPPPSGEGGLGHRAESDSSPGYAIAIDECPASSELPPFRTHVRRQDVDAIEALTRRTGVFNEEEVGVACELAEETLAKGEETSGYYFLFADGEHGLEAFACRWRARP